MVKKSRIMALLIIFILSIALNNVITFADSNNYKGDKNDIKVSYEDGDGKVDYVTYHQPPKNFDPVSASDEELMYYGFPARPSDPEKIKDWEKIVSGGTFVKPAFAKGIKKSSNTTGYTYQGSYNWGGVIKYANMTNVAGCWQVPSVTADSSHRPAFSCSWIGLGGGTQVSGGSSLAQIGTNSFVDSSGVSQYNVWWEMLNMNPHYPTQQIITSIPCSGNQGIYSYIYVSFSSSSRDYAASGTVGFYIKNTSNGMYTSFTKNFSNAYYLGAQAEWIFERPQVNGDIYNVNLSKPTSGYAPFWSCQYSTNGFNNYQYVADSSTTTLCSIYNNPTDWKSLAIPSSIRSSGTFDVYWYNYK